MFEYSLVSGLTASGADVFLLHVTTTPSVSHVTRTEDFDCGIMISASHNPYYDNGIKLLNGFGEKMDESVISLIEAYLDGQLEAFGKQYQVATDLQRFNLMTLSIESRTVMETNYLSTQEPSYVAVFGSTEFASDTILDSAAYGNADVLTATLRHMGREVMPADLEFKAFKVFNVDTQVTPVNAGSAILTTALLTLLPIALCTAIGVIIGVKRKYR